MELRQYQKDIASTAVDRLKQLGMVYIAMEVRTGKTITSLHVAHLYMAKKVLFVTKKKAISSILSDYEQMGYNFDIECINYESLHKIENNPDFIIVDEAHCLGAFPKAAKRQKVLKRIAYNIPVVFLSGTPTPETYSQIYYQFDVCRLNPFCDFANFYEWARRYVKISTKEYNGYSTVDYSDANIDAIKAIIDPYMISFSQGDAGFTCPVNEHFIYVDDRSSALLIKRLFRDKVIDVLDDNYNGHKIVADTASKLMSKMHQLSGGTCITEGDIRIVTSREKIKKIGEIFKGKKIAIFYKFISEGDVIRSYYGNACTDNPEEFQAATDKIFVSQVISGREGIALHSADAIVFYNIDYSATSYWQARARLQTLNRSTPANIYWVVTSGGIERKVYSAVSNKKDFTLSYFVKNGAFNV